MNTSIIIGIVCILLPIALLFNALREIRKLRSRRIDEMDDELLDDEMDGNDHEDGSGTN